jgi:hypothetical protein
MTVLDCHAYVYVYILWEYRLNTLEVIAKFGFGVRGSVISLLWTFELHSRVQLSIVLSIGDQTKK